MSDQKLLLDASKKGDSDTVARLIASGVDVNEPYRGRTAIHFAAAAGRVEVLTKLLDAGADPNTRSQGDTPLLRAAQKGKTEAIALLLDRGADLAATAETGETAVHLAAWHSKVKALKLLIARGADIEHGSNTRPLTATIGAASHKGLGVLLSAGADPNAPGDNTGDRALHLAVRFDDVEAIRLLVKAGADVNISNDAGQTPLSLLKSGQDEARALMEHAS